MPTRITPLTVAVIALTGALVGPSTSTAQVHRVVDPTWETPRTADGQPDLQGLWGNKRHCQLDRRRALFSQIAAGLRLQSTGTSHRLPFDKRPRSQ